jgi:hypothetical protein
MNFFNKWKSLDYNPSFDYFFENSLSLKVSKLTLIDSPERNNKKQERYFYKTSEFSDEFQDLPHRDISLSRDLNIQRKLKHISASKVSLKKIKNKIKYFVALIAARNPQRKKNKKI